ncbi:retrovirus-related pol polyprotein from transposon TNT 1-94 [Tanacetum coccineum]|uniref:Retrovirus-related pol polyprotein from transposon TNT 1-94 n=1 Tax=Tanacetum coccineum TaxID=301880 RepID=A0ABQ4Y4I5_9ASTR
MPVNTPLPTTDVREKDFDINSPLGEQVVDLLMENVDVAGLPRHLVKRLFSHLLKNLSLTKRMSDEPLGDDSKPRSYDVTFSNPLFDFNDDFTLCNDNSLFDEEFEDISSLESPKSAPLNYEPLGNPDSVSRSLETSDLIVEELTAEIDLDDSILIEIDDRIPYDREDHRAYIILNVITKPYVVKVNMQVDDKEEGVDGESNSEGGESSNDENDDGKKVVCDAGNVPAADSRNIREDEASRVLGETKVGDTFIGENGTSINGDEDKMENVMNVINGDIVNGISGNRVKEWNSGQVKKAVDQSQGDTWHSLAAGMRFQKYQYEEGKKHSHKPKAEDSIQENLYLLHMDLYGPMRVQSINRRKYIRVIVDDFSRFTLVKFLRSKDEVPEFVIKFLKMIQVRLNATLRNIKTDNGIEFAEAVTTTCYTQNQSLIRKLVTTKRDLSYLHVFGALYYPTNDGEDLCMLKLKDDIGIFVGYAPAKKAFRIYNKRTRMIIETIHVDFDELTTLDSEQLCSGPGP